MEDGVGPYLELESVLRVETQSDMEKKFAGTPLMRPKRAGMIRNAICVAVNTGCSKLAPQLRVRFEEDEDEQVRALAIWGLSEFAKQCDTDLWKLVVEAKNDESELVRKEVTDALRNKQSL